MYTYKLVFDNGKKYTSTSGNLDKTHSKIVSYMKKRDLKECIITCPNNIVRRVRKTGEYHWKHNGFSFD